MRSNYKQIASTRHLILQYNTCGYTVDLKVRVTEDMPDLAIEMVHILLLTGKKRIRIFPERMMNARKKIVEINTKERSRKYVYVSRSRCVCGRQQDEAGGDFKNDYFILIVIIHICFV